MDKFSSSINQILVEMDNQEISEAKQQHTHAELWSDPYFRRHTTADSDTKNHNPKYPVGKHVKYEGTRHVITSSTKGSDQVTLVPVGKKGGKLYGHVKRQYGAHMFRAEEPGASPMTDWKD